MISIFRKSSKKVIEAIHNEFNSAGDKLLSEAKEILQRTKLDNEQKAEMLQRHGFTQTKEVAGLSEVKQKTSLAKSVSKAINSLSLKFPQYKFITEDAANEICKKYNLVIGGVSQYKGFVPEKNLRQINDFFKTKSEINYWYYRSMWGLMMRREERAAELTESEFAARQNMVGDFYSFGHGNRSLMIAAPLKEMETKGFKLIGRILQREIPDPVVLCPITVDGVNLYTIVTAWGDESGDPLVVNEKLN
jgi:hypothetical protein